MFKVTNFLWIGNVGEFGNAPLLKSNGIQLAILFHNGAFPHTTEFPQMMIAFNPEGTSPDWFIKGLARLLAIIYGLKIMSLHDETGGLTLASFAIVGANAEKNNISYTTSLNQVQGLISNMQIPSPLNDQGNRIWP